MGRGREYVPEGWVWIYYGPGRHGVTVTVCGVVQVCGSSPSADA